MNKNTKSVLVIEDDRQPRMALKAAFRKCRDFKFKVRPVENLEQAENLLAKRKYDVVTIDLGLGGDAKAGFRLMERRMIFASCPDAVKIVVTGLATYESCVKAMRLGAWDFIEKVQDYDTRAVESAVERLKENEEARRAERYIFEEWLPKHECKLQKKFPGEYVAVTDGRVIAHARTMISLGKGFSAKSSKGSKMPYILYIGESKHND